MSQQIVARHPLSTVFLLHIALEAPLAVQGLWSPASLPFLQLNNTSLVFIKLYASFAFASCVAAILCFTLPEFLPGKRAVALSLMIYHMISSTVLIGAPRFVPVSFGDFFERFKLTPEVLWGSGHGLLALGFATWWQITLAYGQAIKKA